ncbi:hypothetical protein B0T10DRAFT_568657 [Thelonectria olida]|uniref:Uncharacterized protein n=1 Tax=Thelonectria olida TaxID=1576542 RepID=A0A9P8VSK9_9HYPO|nr:hypothetical protein B0T10DRAFT_568657 [Thelonectria olida]
MPFAHGGSGYVISGETVRMMTETRGLAHKYDLIIPPRRPKTTLAITRRAGEAWEQEHYREACAHRTRPLLLRVHVAGSRYQQERTKYEEGAKDANFNRDRQCFQWRYHNKACCLAGSFKLGKSRPEEDPKDKWSSGWFIEGINKWIEAKGDCQPEKSID